ncbi:MAG: adenylate/guanylate cyclase domain-containing protein [Rubrivivax sp.]|nr:adenylate/guanylate cyclase domain-containing protein [Rubrivivax sp.]
MMEVDLSGLSMTDIIRLQTQLSQELARRFETSAGLAFSDIVGSTAYFARFGDEAGRQLQQLHVDLMAPTLGGHGGRIVDVAGDGVFACFASAASAALAMTELLQRISLENTHRERSRQLNVRIGLHWGRVLTDGVQVTGDAVNLCARIAASAEPGQIRVSRETFLELAVTQRLLCHRLETTALKGIDRDVELFDLAWRDPQRFPSAVLVRESGQTLPLPSQDIVSLGRLELVEGMPANDIVLSLPDPQATRQISRWHCELRRRPEGYVLRAVSGQSTTVDGTPVPQGEDVPILPGSVAVLSGVMTLVFQSPIAQFEHASETTAIVQRRPR